MLVDKLKRIAKLAKKRPLRYIRKKRYDEPFEVGDRVLHIPKDLPCEIMKVMRKRCICKDRFNKDHLIYLKDLQHI